MLIPTVPNHPAQRFYVGCVATALAQVLNYFEYPKSLRLHSGLRYRTPTLGIRIDEDAASFSFLTFDQAARDLIVYNNSIETKAYLSFAAGVSVRMDYGLCNTFVECEELNSDLQKCYSSGALTSDVQPALLNVFGYGSAERRLLWSEEDITEDIRHGRPVILGIKLLTLDRFWTGHAIVVDGYNQSTREYHMNFGWGGDNDGWYTVSGSTFKDLGDRLWFIYRAIHSISPEASWNQVGADENNSFRSPYNIPKEDNEKWFRSCQGDQFTGLVVGQGNKVYASCGHSMLTINQFGEPLADLPLPEVITGPAQNSQGILFVGSDSGRVYRIDPINGAISQPFTEPGGNQIVDAPKVDKEDFVYVHTLNSLYRLNPDGSRNWELRFSGNKLIQRKPQPAIDTTHNRVYITYDDLDARRGTIVSIIRENGTATERTLDNAFFGNGSSPPSVGSDGTVYVGTRLVTDGKVSGRVFALNPDTFLGPPRWSQAFGGPVTVAAPAIGATGTIYIVYQALRAEGWRDVLTALDSGDGSVHWEVTLPADPQMNNFLQPYVDFRGVVIVPRNISAEPQDHWEVYAFEDLGNSASPLWTRNQNNAGAFQAGRFAVGAGSTLYIAPAAGNTITAVSEGERGDPFGAAMGFVDDTAPNAPLNITPDNEESNIVLPVTLSWRASDPDGHVLTYDVFLGTGSISIVGSEEIQGGEIPLHTQGLTEALVEVSDLEPGLKYFWRVVASDGQIETEGPVWNFTLAAIAFRRSDANSDGRFDLGDAIFNLLYLFLEAPEPSCLDAADFTDDGIVNVTDAIAIINFVLLGGSVPPEPYPECGQDDSRDKLSCSEATPECF